MAAKFSSAAATRGVSGSQFDAPESRSPEGGRGTGLRTAGFDAVYRQGSRRTTSHFLVLARPNGLDCSRFGISVKTALGGAVLRNRIKRRVRELLRRARRRVPVGWDIVVEPRTRQVARADFSLLGEELTRLLASVAH